MKLFNHFKKVFMQPTNFGFVMKLTETFQVLKFYVWAEYIF